MAITKTSGPTEIDNTSQWVVETSLVEDSTHVNLRVEATIYKGVTQIAKKVMPKGYLTFDFRKILEDMVKFQNPVISDYNGEKIIQPSDESYATNLINSWSNSVMSPFDTFTSAGRVITSAISDGSSECLCASNLINMTKGQLYVLMFEQGTINSITDATTLEIYFTTDSNVIKFPVDGNQSRYYLLYKGDYATRQIIMKCNVGKSINFSSGNLGLYPLTDVDWYVPYYVVFTEKYENAAGITQTGASLDTSTDLYFFIKSDAAVIEDYQLGTAGSKFLLHPDLDIITADSVEITVDDSVITADGYSGTTRSISHTIPKTVPAGKVSLYYGIISPRKSYYISIVVKHYNASFVLQSTEEIGYEYSFHPIFIVHIDQTVVATYPVNGVLVRYWDHEASPTPVGVNATEEVFVVQDATKFPQIVNLVWKNSMGGFSSFMFYSQIEKGKKTERNYFKNVSQKNRVLSVTKTDYIIASTKLHLTEDELSYLLDILESDLVYWQYDAGVLTEVCLTTESLASERSEEIMQSTIEFEY